MKRFVLKQLWIAALGLSFGSNAWAGNVGAGANVGLGYLYCLSGAAPLMCANGPDAVADMTIAGVNSKNDGQMNLLC
ncbi:hypothetical protein C2I33_21215, partial [Ralstonia solanacearum]